MIEYLQENWLIVVIMNSILTLTITPIIINIINKKTIKLTTADDVIKLKEYNKNKNLERKKNIFKTRLYKTCFQKQKKYKGWYLGDFQEFGPIESRWFSVKNKEGECMVIRFPENLIVRRYGYDPNDRLQNKPFVYIPNIIERFINYLYFKNSKYKIKKYKNDVIQFLEERKNKNEKIEISELSKKFSKLKSYTLGSILNEIKDENNRIDLIEIITIREIGTNETKLFFNN
jgi:hypothetical protein